MTTNYMDRNALVLRAKLSEYTERYDEMLEHIKAVAHFTKELSVEERNLLSVAYKSAGGARRASWRVLTSILQRGDPDQQEHVKIYLRRVERELEDICTDALRLMDTVLIPNSSTDESKVYYYKMKGDYNRYLAEIQSGNAHMQSSEAASLAYQMASDIASAKLPSTHPLRLGLALNFSVYYYEILNSPERACKLSKDAFDDAIADLDTLSEESYKDSTLIMQLLRDNLTLWTTDQDNLEEEIPTSLRD